MNVDATDFDVLYDFGTERVEDVMALFADTDWAAHRTREDIVHMMANTQVLVGLQPAGSDSFVGFARALSDGRYKAVIEDVVVAAGVRNLGVGHVLMAAVMAHPVVATVEEVELYCHPDRLRFYRDAGFSVVDDQLFMRHVN